MAGPALLVGRPWLYSRMGGTGAAFEAALTYSNGVFAGAVLVWVFNVSRQNLRDRIRERAQEVCAANDVLLAECGLAAQRADAAKAPEVQATYERYTQRAIDAGVFGAPSYVVDGEIFWGQDRLELLPRHPAAGRK